MSALLDLADRCERAEGPDRRLDAQIGAALRYYPRDDGWLSEWPGEFVAAKFEGRIAALHKNGEMAVHWEALPYTASIDSAMTLVPEGWMLDRLGEDWGIDTWAARLIKRPSSGQMQSYAEGKAILLSDEWGQAQTGPPALTAACLRAHAALTREK